MKANYRKLVVLGLFLLALNTVLLAQDLSSKVRVNIPFAFYAGEKMLPAGNYTFSLNRETSNIAIRSEDSDAGVFLFGSPNFTSSNALATLTFHSNSNGRYLLEKFEGPDFGYSFPEHKTGAKASGAVAKIQTSPDTRVVIARLLQ